MHTCAVDGSIDVVGVEVAYTTGCPTFHVRVIELRGCMHACVCAVAPSPKFFFMFPVVSNA